MSVTIVSTLPRASQATPAEVSAVSAATGDKTATVDFASLLLGLGTAMAKTVAPAAVDLASVQIGPGTKETIAKSITPATVDLASLSLGQFASLRPVAPETAQKASEQTDPALSEPVSSDPAALLAALGLVPQESSRTADHKKAEESSSLPDSADAAPGVMQATAFVAQSLEPLAGTKSVKADEASLPAIGKVDKALPESMPASGPAPAIAGADHDPKAPLSPLAAAPATTAIDAQPAKFAAVTAIVPSSETPAAKIVTADATPSGVPALAGNPTTPPVRHEASLSVATPVRDQAWASELGQKVVWLASNDKQSAQITLNPPQMGPIEISLSIDKGSATASFTSANAEVRNALETAMPKLREMFASAGIELGQTNVSAESFKQQAENGNANRGASQWRSDNAILVANSGPSLSARAIGAQHGNGLVDIFA